MIRAKDYTQKTTKMYTSITFLTAYNSQKYKIFLMYTVETNF